MAEIPVPYTYDGRAFEGLLVYDDSIADRRPAILMQPDWLGVCPHAAGMAEDVAGKDYVVMIADMFGAGYGARDKDFDELMKVSRAVRADLPHILGCSAAADRAMTAEAAGARADRRREARRHRLLHRRRLCPRTVPRRRLLPGHGGLPRHIAEPGGPVRKTGFQGEGPDLPRIG